MAEAFEFGLRVFDVEGAGEAAFCGERGDASGDGADGAESEFADFAECLAEGAGEAASAFPGCGVHTAGDVAFEGFAEVLAGGCHLHVYGADVLCHRGPPS